MAKKDYVGVENAAAAKQKIAWNAQTVWTRSNMADQEKKNNAVSKENVCKIPFKVEVIKLACKNLLHG